MEFICRYTVGSTLKNNQCNLPCHTKIILKFMWKDNETRIAKTIWTLFFRCLKAYSFIHLVFYSPYRREVHTFKDSSE